MDTQTRKIVKGMIVKAKYSQIMYRLERIMPVRKGKTVENELHFHSLDPYGQGFRMMEQDYRNNTVFIINCYPQ